MLWTVVPVIILALISVPSFKLLYFVDRHPDPEMTLKVIGHQWYWTYEYPDQGGITFDSNIACATTCRMIFSPTFYVNIKHFKLSSPFNLPQQLCISIKG